ncbi:hypothetical protein DLAC_03749 [Tieghemostelium lacteum]|uniref:Uncharacterized protein n=1 Tax=Tieghemostelium lacteum TaxID=361077 RepID=A0A152A0L9_TIELA|nr:hypothetical protein DLAC_03749 [Tieghemostelium lacteum]|eukprot:KYQ99801.1 hypothetical protein DLAC_03749 [Tieghemostelium lacteum]
MISLNKIFSKTTFNISIATRFYVKNSKPKQGHYPSKEKRAKSILNRYDYINKNDTTKSFLKNNGAIDSGSLLPSGLPMPVFPVPKYSKQKEVIQQIEQFEKQLINNPTETLKSDDNYDQYYKYLAHKLKIKMPSDWYKVKRKDFISHYGQKVLDEYGGDHIRAIVSHFPQENWKLWKFPTVQKSFWFNRDNQHQYIEWLVKVLKKGEEKEEWHYLSQRNFRENYGSYFLDTYGGVYEALSALYPQYPWKPWLFEKLSNITIKAYFERRVNEQFYMTWLASKLGFQVTDYDKWYTLENRDLKMNEGTFLLYKYKKSCYKLVTSILGQPEESQWHTWRFKVAPKKRLNIDILQDYINYLKKTFNLETDQQLLDNQIITEQVITDTHGQPILTEFGGSIQSALESLANKDSIYKRNQVEENEGEDEGKDFDDLYELDSSLQEQLDHQPDEEIDTKPRHKKYSLKKKNQ